MGEEGESDISTYASSHANMQRSRTHPVIRERTDGRRYRGKEVLEEEQARLSLMIPPRRVLLPRIPPSPDVVKQVESCVDV